MRSKLYNAVMEVTDSDHKPVWALLTVDMPVVIQDQKREVCCRVLQQAYAASAPTAEPQVEVSAGDVRLHQVRQIQDQCCQCRWPQYLRQNKCHQCLCCCSRCQRQHPRLC